MKLTSEVLKRIIEEEVGKFGKERDTEKEANKTDEVDADEYADTLEKKIDYAKALKVEETRLLTRLKKIQETRQRVLKSLKK